MAEAAFGSSAGAGRTAVLVMNSGATSLLCPFFNKCDGVLLIDAADGSEEFHACDCTGTKSMCDLILELRPERIICGFIVEPEMQKLRAARIDVRLGSCSCPVDELVSVFHSLPRA